MAPIHANQIKAARAILGWSQEQLAAAAGLSVATIHNLERGMISPRSATTLVVRQAVEKAGLEFIDPEGVRRRRDDIQIHQGADSCEAFWDDLQHTVAKNPSEIVAVFPAAENLAQACGLASDISPLEQLGRAVGLRCLVAAAPVLPLADTRIQFRTVMRHTIGPVSYLVFGNKHALVLPEEGAAFRFIVCQSTGLAQAYRTHFLALWEHAVPVGQDAPRALRRVRA